jgi:hypothetical protein
MWMKLGPAKKKGSHCEIPKFGPRGDQADVVRLRKDGFASR